MIFDSEFKTNYVAAIVISKDLKRVFLVTNEKLGFATQSDKLNVLTVEAPKDGTDHIYLSKKINELVANIKVDPPNWRPVCKLRNYVKEWQVKFYMATVDNLVFDHSYDISNLPVQTIPYLKWVIPMSVDLGVYASDHNQILMR